MPHFQYSALTQDGQTVNGQVQAESRQTAISDLARGGKFVTVIDTAGAGALPRAEAGRREQPAPGGPARVASGWSLRRRRTVSARSHTAMLNQLAVALQSGLPLLVALRVVEEQAEHAALAELARDLAERVQSGESLSDAMQALGRQFSQLEVAMVRVGETAGVLDQTVGHLADFAERDLDVREKIRSAATYPLFVLTLAVISVIIILTWILPNIMETLLADMDPALLPWPTRTLLAVSGFLSSYYGLLALVLVIFAGFAFRNWLRAPEGRFTFDRFLLRVPVLGQALRKIAVARFSRTLGTLTRSGIQIIEAMQVIRGTLGNEALARQIDQVTSDISEGQSIAEPLRQTGQFPPLLTQVIAMGERTGRLDVLLLQTADSYEKETAAALGRVMTILPAVFIVCLALMVAFILAAVLLPIIGMDITGADF